VRIIFKKYLLARARVHTHTHTHTTKESFKKLLLITVTYFTVTYFTVTYFKKN